MARRPLSSTLRRALEERGIATIASELMDKLQAARRVGLEFYIAFASEAGEPVRCPHCRRALSMAEEKR